MEPVPPWAMGSAPATFSSAGPFGVPSSEASRYGVTAGITATGVSVERSTVEPRVCGSTTE